jgi:folate-binding protein YgfZ
MAWIEFSGPDAREYLQRLSTVDARALRPGEGAPGLFLNAQGRIQASFHLWCLEDSRFAFELEGGPGGKLKQNLLDWIEQYHFGEKFEISEPAGLSSLWIFDWGEDWTTRVKNGVRSCNAGDIDLGRPLITLWGERSALEALGTGAEATLEDLERKRIEALAPRAGHELTPESSPLEAGFTAALAMNKGCYPGQEVIEKTISLGQPAQRLCRLEGKGEPPAVGSALMNQGDPPSQLGKITSVAREGDGFVALGFVRKIHAKEGLELAIEGGAGIARIAAVSAFSKS